MPSSQVYKFIKLSFLQDMGLKVLTNSRVRKPQSCSRIYQHEAESFPALPMSHRGKKKKLLLSRCHIQQ